MKNAHFSFLFATLSLVACGSNDARNIATADQPVSTHSTPSNTSIASSVPEPSASPSGLNTPDPSSTPMPTPAPTPTVSAPEPTPTPTAAPTAVPSDPYVGTYAAITLALYADKCAGACAPSITVNPLVVTHDNDAYQINGLNASSLAGDVLNVSVTGPGELFNCSNVAVDDEYGIQNEPNGTTYELVTHTTVGDCHGGVHYTCQCQYDARVR